MKDLSSARLLDALGTAKEVYVSGCSAEIPDLPDLLGEGLQGATVTGILSPLLNERSYASAKANRRCRTFFLNKEVKEHLTAGIVDLCPWTYTQMARWFRSAITFDAAVVMVSPPNELGQVSLGVQADFLPLFRERVGKLIGVVNPNMPWTAGATAVPLDAFSDLFALDRPIAALPAAGASLNEAILRIAASISELIPDGATMQLGIGKIPQGVARMLGGHRDLAIVSGLIDDDILSIEDQNVLDKSKPIVTGVAMGSADLYARLHKNPRFSFQPASETHNVEKLIGIERFHSINAALQVDLLGQINSEMVNGRLISVPGGFPDFIRGASLNPTGRAIVALQARPNRNAAPGIVPRFSTPAAVTATKTVVDIVVTEFGVAQLRNLSLDQRAEALIGIATPEDRDQLQAEWTAFRSRAFGSSERRVVQNTAG